MWLPQINFFKSTYHVIAYDIRSFGKSTNDLGELSIDIFARDLIKFMDAIVINKAIICGLSMGGFIALNAVANFPERFLGLVLCDTNSEADTEENRIKRYETIQQIETTGINDYTNGFIKKAFSSNTLLNNQTIANKIEKVIRANPPHVITAGIVALAKRSATNSILNKISIPTCIVCGTDDIITPPSQSEYMHKKIKNSTLYLINNAGHLSNLEQPEVFNLHLNKFLLSCVDFMV